MINRAPAEAGNRDTERIEAADGRRHAGLVTEGLRDHPVSDQLDRKFPQLLPTFRLAAVDRTSQLPRQTLNATVKCLFFHGDQGQFGRRRAPQLL
jgi:hypothetical protein